MNRNIYPIDKMINNPGFNYPEFGVIENESGVNRFIMSVGQWIDRTGAISLIVRVNLIDDSKTLVFKMYK